MLIDVLDFAGFIAAPCIIPLTIVNPPICLALCLITLVYVCVRPFVKVG